MKRSLTLAGAVGAAILAAAPAAHAQGGAMDSQCAHSDVRVQDICQKSADLFNFMAPQLGTALAGGNAVLGQSGSLGFLHFSIGLRANAVQGVVPTTNDVSVSTTGATRSDFGDKKQVLPAPAAEVELGIFPGIPLGLTSVGSVDAIVSANYIPNYDNDNFSLKTDDGSLKLGFGGRLGILKESILVPGVSVTYLRRDLPKISLSGPVASSGSQADDTLGVSGLTVKTTAIRGVVGKKFGLLGLAVGAGQDKYESHGALSAVVHDAGTCAATQGCRGDAFFFDQSVTRTSYFADVQLNLVILKLIGEIGQVSGGNIPATYNSFGSAKANDARTYGSVGLRFGF